MVNDYKRELENLGVEIHSIPEKKIMQWYDNLLNKIEKNLVMQDSFLEQMRKKGKITI